MCKVILDYFFLKYERGFKLTPPRKNNLQKPSLITVKRYTKIDLVVSENGWSPVSYYHSDKGIFLFLGLSIN